MEVGAERKRHGQDIGGREKIKSKVRSKRQRSRQDKTRQEIVEGKTETKKKKRQRRKKRTKRETKTWTRTKQKTESKAKAKAKTKARPGQDENKAEAERLRDQKCDKITEEWDSTFYSVTCRHFRHFALSSLGSSSCSGQ
jgi:hypothetical protein